MASVKPAPQFQRHQTYTTMLLNQYIDQKKALERWHIHVSETNAKQPVKEHVRIINGQPKVFFRKQKEIATSVKDTGTRLILNYVREFDKVKRAANFAGVVGLLDQLPSLSINCQTLGKLRDLTDRSARAHITKLRKCGLISAYKFHGTRSNFEIWINPSFLWPEAPQEAQNVSFFQTPTASASSPKDIKFPLITSHETLETKEIEIGNVNKGALPGQVALPEGEGTRNSCDTTGNRGAQHLQKPAPQAQNLSPENKQLETEVPAGAAPKKALQPEFLAYVENFWNYAWQVLYPQVSFTEYEQKQAKNAIYRSVYYGFRANLSDQEWQEAHEFLLQRLDLAAGYYQRHPNQYPPMPYGQFVPGSGYFDHENQYGFRNTEEWLVNWLTRKHQRKIEDALLQARRDFGKHQKGVARKRIQDKSPLKLFRYHENKFKILGKKALERFYAQFSEPTKPQI